MDVRASRACQLAETLGWAVSSGVPIPAALRSLPFYRAHSPEQLDLLKSIAWLLTPTFYWLYLPWLNDLRWSARINHIIEDLESGLELGPTLQWWLGRFIPPFYLQGLMRAESEDRLETALPILAEQMAYPLSVSRRRFMAVLGPALQILIVSSILLFLLTFIYPSIQQLLGYTGSRLWVPPMSSQLAGVLALLLAGLCLWTCGLLLLPHLGHWGRAMSHRLPWVGPNRRRFLVMDVGRMLAASLRQGDDLLTAATLAAKATPSIWLKHRLHRFTDSLQRGDPWLEAWRTARIGGAFGEWALRNADSREDPAAGFELIAEWSHQQIEAGTGRLEYWAAPVTSLLLGIGVAVFAVTIIRALTGVLLQFL